ncbi:MAG: GTP-binding protein [Promethearchaeota archaeon]
MKQFKIVILGDYKAGKTSLINRFVKQEFFNLHIPTVGFKFLKKTTLLENDLKYEVVFWDTGGLSSQKVSMRQKIFKFTDAVIIVIDSQSKDKKNILNRWEKYVRENNNDNVPIFIIFTKFDLTSSYINIEEMFEKQLLTNSGLQYFLVSAKTDENVKESFAKIINFIVSCDKKRNSNAIIEKVSRYKKYNLELKEIEALEELEEYLIKSLGNFDFIYPHNLNSIKREGFPILFKIDEDSFGISIENGNVSGIGLFNCNLNNLPNSSVNFKFLKRLTLRCNPLNNVPEIIANLKSIEYLDLALTNLSFFPKTIKNLNNLKELNLANNRLTSLPDRFGNLQSLNILNLENNPIKKLPDSICNLRYLRELYLEAPTFFFKGNLTELPNNLGNLISLKILDLSSCELVRLPESIGNLEGLNTLDLYNNNLISLPDSIGKLKQLEILNLETNNLETVPDSIGHLVSLKRISLKNNPLRKKGSDKFKALALKSTGRNYDRLMEIAEICRLEEFKFRSIQKTPLKKKYRFIKALSYAVSVALIGFITFLNININSQTSNFMIWFLFVGALIINLLIGTCIIATLSRYFKISVMFFKKRIYKYFDIFVIIYLIWSLRAVVKITLSVELIPSINFLFEFTIPETFLNFLTILGYDLDLTFLENIDLFFGHFYLKIFSSALVFWALYRNGFGHIKRTAFEEKKNRNMWSFLLIGLFGAFSLAVMNYSNLKPFLSIGYDIGVIFGGYLFIWEKNRPKKSYFLTYILLILGSISLIWVLSLWNMIISVITSIILIILYFIIRRIQNKKLSLYLY